MAGKGLFDKTAFATFWSQLKLKLGTHGGIVSGKGLSSNDYTTAEKEKLAGLDDVYSQLGHSHDISEVDGLNDRLGELEDSIDDIGGGFETVIITGSTASMSSSDIYQKHQNGIVVKCLCEFSDGRSLLLSLAEEPTESMAIFSETTFGVADTIISEYRALVVGTIGSSSIVSTQFATSDEVSGGSSTTVTNYVPIVTGASTDGTAYTATADDFELVAGRVIVFVPSRVSASTSVTLNINSTGAKRIYQGTSYNTATKLTPATPTWLAANKPILLKYDGTYWITVEARAYASDLYGTLPVTKGGTGATTAETARANLEVYSTTEVDSLVANVSGGSGGGGLPTPTFVETDYSIAYGDFGGWFLLYVRFPDETEPVSLGIHYLYDYGIGSMIMPNGYNVIEHEGWRFRFCPDGCNIREIANTSNSGWSFSEMGMKLYYAKLS